MHGEEVMAMIDFLRSRNRKYSIERADLVEVINSMKGPFSVGELFSAAFRARVVFAKSTLYRNVELFIAAGIIREVGKIGGKMCYETEKHRGNVVTRGDAGDSGKLKSSGLDRIAEDIRSDLAANAYAASRQAAVSTD